MLRKQRKKRSIDPPIHIGEAFLLIQSLNSLLFFFLSFFPPFAVINLKRMDNDAEQAMGISSTVPGSSDGSNPKSSSLVSRVKKLLFRKMLVGIKDGRFFLGTFHCIDKQGNIILQDAVEYRSTRRSSPSPMEQRCLGLILIPSSCRTSCHVDCSIEEQLSLLKFQE
ncbi:uncharacterized protein LOC110646565 isoform X2 [Hevea brasiliensis]|uniref:uncharacterized protein LOC110646565 isoform X2 n=1 Tax=Hevea brasiliensis TaxID=3981 RepID=UPI0025FCC30C|nr:uncharacterized protein LOC110646565 isoform X2 [Hevea brasiliensis]